MSAPCAQCGKVKRVRMHVDAHTGRPVYLCSVCERELGYAKEAHHASS